MEVSEAVDVLLAVGLCAPGASGGLCAPRVPEGLSAPWAAGELMKGLDGSRYEQINSSHNIMNLFLELRLSIYIFKIQTHC